MDARIKNVLGIVFVAGLVVVSVVLLCGLHLLKENIRLKQPKGTIAVNGEGRVVMVPDVALVQLAVVTEGGLDLAGIQKKNTEQSNEIISFVKAHNVEKGDIQTVAYNVTPRVDWARYRDKIFGYTVTQQLLVKLRDMNAVGEIIGGAVERGANNVSGPSFTVDDSTQVRNKAREIAISQAREQAQSIAASSGFALGRLVSFEERHVGPRAAQTFYMEADTQADKSVAPKVEAGSNTETVTVTMTYEIR